jgi:peptide/nickel transport system ATP-binding protein
MEKGKTVALLGESGCGKSLTARTIVGILPSSARVVHGKALFEGQDLLTLSESERARLRGRKISYVPQNPAVSLSPIYAVGEQFQDLLIWQGRPRADIFGVLKRDKEIRKSAESKAIELLRAARIPSPEMVMERYPFELSGGMQQRVLISMALAGNPELLIADEPSTALDVTVQAKINQMLIEMVRERNVLMLYITHDLSLTRGMCDRIYVMYAGNVVESADVGDIFREPLHPYTVGLISSVPRLRGAMSEGIPGRIPDYANPPTGCRFHPRCVKRMDVCNKVIPPFIEASPKHFVRCHLYGWRDPS